MVFKKTFKKTYNKTKRNETAYTMARKALTKINKLDKQIEVKHYSDSYNTALLSGTSHSIEMTAIGANGTNNESHIGDKTTLKYLRINFQLSMSAAGWSRIIVAYFPEGIPAGTVPAMSDLISDTLGGVGLYKINQEYKYKVLYDKVVTFNTNTLNALRILKFKLNETLNQDGVTSVGKIVLFYNALGGTMTPRIEYRLSYTDL